MSKPYLIGVDIGTMGTKAAVFDTQGNLVASAYEESVLHYPKPGWVEADPEDLYGSSVRTIRECLEKGKIDPHDVAALAFDGQMSGIGTIDAAWGTPTPYDSWLDTRCKPYIEMMRPHADQIIRASGGPPTYCHGPKILWWKHERPEVFEKIDKFVVPVAYVAGRMGGLKRDEAYVDSTHLTFSSFADAARLAWDADLCDLFDVPVEKLPRIVEPWAVVGKVTAAAAADCGLCEGTPLAAGCGDQAAGMLGAAMVEPGTVLDAAGTASLVGICVDRFVPDVKNKALFTARLVQPDGWYAMAFINGGGLNLRWFRDEIMPDVNAQAKAQGKSFYAVLDELATKVSPGSDNLMFLPHLGGSVCPSDPDLRGLWLGFTWAHTRPHFYRAILEAVAYEYALYLGIERALMPDLKFHETRVIGGGAVSPVWNQIKADVLGMPYVQLNQSEYAVLGAAILGGYAVGVFSDLKATARSFVTPSTRIEPRPEIHERYRPLVELYQSLAPTTRPLFQCLADIH
ncbi:MAG: xylulokinase [Nitrososphaerales archaeon]